MSQRKRKSGRAAVRSRFPWAAVAIGIVLVVSAAVVLLGSGAPPDTGAGSFFDGGPRVNADRSVVDLGRVPFDQVVSAQFTLENVGNEPLRIAGEPRVELIEGC